MPPRSSATLLRDCLRGERGAASLLGSPAPSRSSLCVRGGVTVRRAAPIQGGWKRQRLEDALGGRHGSPRTRRRAMRLRPRALEVGYAVAPRRGTHPRSSNRAEDRLAEVAQRPESRSPATTAQPSRRRPRERNVRRPAGSRHSTSLQAAPRRIRQRPSERPRSGLGVKGSRASIRGAPLSGKAVCSREKCRPGLGAVSPSSFPRGEKLELARPFAYEQAGTSRRALQADSPPAARAASRRPGDTGVELSSAASPRTDLTRTSSSRRGLAAKRGSVPTRGEGHPHRAAGVVA